MSSRSKYHAFLDAKVLEDQAAQAKRSLTIFLAGPFIDVNKTKAAKANKATSASAARYAVYKSLEALGNLVLLGEHKRLAEASKSSFSELNNAVLYERKMILDDEVSAVIILPSSPGSFLEFGDWANEGKIGRKLLVLIDKQYEKHKNYLNLGPVLIASALGAEVDYIPYDDHDALLNRIEIFLDKIAAKKNVERLYGRSK